MTERRYSEEEVAEIFKQATEVQQHARRHLPAGEGMTLADLQAIGSDIGVPAELVARVARSLDLQESTPTRRFLGLPIGVGRSVELHRTMTESEWEYLVVDLRQTFDARGVVRSDGSLRQWTNGNLQVFLEPGENGHRVRMRTFNEMARVLMTGGVGALVASGVAAAMSINIGGWVTLKALMGLSVLTAMGIVLFGAGALRLPRWARRRQEQMDGVAARLALPPTPVPGTGPDSLP